MAAKRPSPKVTVADRLDRMEAGLQRIIEITQKESEENQRFHQAVRAATTSLFEQQQENSRAIDALTKSVAKHDKIIADLERQWQAYLSTIHPKQ